MRKLLTALCVVAMLSLAVSPVAAQGSKAQIDEVLSQVENIRGLSANQDIAVNFLSQKELRDKMLEEFEEENPEEELDATQEIMVMLGFIEPDLDLQKLLVDLYTEQIAGFYDQEDKSLYLISEEKEKMSAMDRYVLSHELTHYLQDQNFNLMRPPFHDPEDAETVTDDDAAFAASCLAEGDAMLTSDTWLADNLDTKEMMEMQSEAGEFSTKVFDSAPEYIQDSLLFPYQEGKKFVEHIHDRGGYAAVNQAFRNPPQSTEQIYHPEKYEKKETPVKVELPDLSGRLGEDWELAYDNVLGEFDVYELFKPFFAARTASRIAEGWGGNGYHYYRSEKEGKLLMQGYAWDSDLDAQEFSSAYLKYVAGRFKGGIKEEPSRGAWRVWSAGGYMLGLKKEGLFTYLLQSTEEGTFNAALEELGESGDQVREDVVEEEAQGKTGKTKDYSWLVIGAVVFLLLLGLILVVVMLLVYRKPPGPPYQPPGGPYGPYPYQGGGPGPFYGGPGGYGGSGFGDAAGGWGQPPHPPPPPQVPPPPPTEPAQ